MNSEKMREVLIKEAKPIMINYLKNDNPVEKVILKYYDKRIRTLDNKNLLKIYELFEKLKKTSKEHLEPAWIKFYLEFCWSFQLDNKWY